MSVTASFYLLLFIWMIFAYSLFIQIVYFKHYVYQFCFPFFQAAPLCRGIEDNAIFTLMAAQITFSFLNFVISHLPNKRRAVLITILVISAVSGLLVNLIPDPITSAVIFVMFTCTCLGMGIMASYFVDLYPTSYR